MDDFSMLERLAIGLTVGLAIGLERGWQARLEPEGSRVAGLRTFALIGLTGAVVALLGLELPLVGAAVAAGLVALLVARWYAVDDPDVGITTETAAIATFGLGILAGLGHFIAAIAGASISAVLLGAKPVLHRWLTLISQRELLAALQMLLIAGVILPLLPDRPMGPFGVLNPRQLWWMVVLTAGVSFAGYIATRLTEARQAALMMGFAGGLVASTVTTLALMRRAKTTEPSLQGALAAGVTAATVAMLGRTLLLATLILPSLLPFLAGPLGLMMIAAGGATAWFSRAKSAIKENAVSPALGNPLDLRIALGFALLLAAASVLIEMARATFGAPGVYMLAALGGLTDVDAITLSLAGQAGERLALEVAATGLMVAVSVNTVVKIALAAVLAPGALAARVAVALGAVVAVGMTASLAFTISID